MKAIVLTLLVLGFLAGVPTLSASSAQEPVYLGDGGDYNTGGG